MGRLLFLGRNPDPFVKWLSSGARISLAEASSKFETHLGGRFLRGKSLFLILHAGIVVELSWKLAI